MFNLLHGHIKDTAVFYIERLFFHDSYLKPYYFAYEETENGLEPRKM